jgi:hypothetical protein
MAIRQDSKLIPTRVETDTSVQQESSSFLKKRTKKLFIQWLTRLIRSVRTEENKSFLVLFFKKELLPSHLACFGGESLSMRSERVSMRRG